MMKKISTDNRGISMLLVIIVIAIVAVAAVGVYFVLGNDDGGEDNKEESGSFTIKYNISGQMNSEQSVFVYLDDEQIDELKNTSGSFSIRATTPFNFADWGDDVTLSAVMKDANGNTIQTVKRDLAVSAENNSHDVSLSFYYTTISVAVLVQLQNDATITISVGGTMLGTYEYYTSPDEETFGVPSYTLIPYDAYPTLTITAKATLPGGYDKTVTQTKNVVKNGTVSFNLNLTDGE
jgi:hypothetical protein